MTLLADLFVKYGTDKGIWGYTPAYEKHLEARRHEVESVLEIGICGNRDIPNNRTGASLFVWRDYFPNAQIIGVDNDSNWMIYGQDRIKTYCCDAYNELPRMRALADAGLTYDFICDDAVHDPLPQINLLKGLWGLLKPRGLYAIEDVCPYKVPNNDLAQHMYAHLFAHDMAGLEETRTHKDEVLVLCTKAP